MHAGVLEPPLGFEPRTHALQKRCSTTELRWQIFSNVGIPTSLFIYQIVRQSKTVAAFTPHHAQRWWGGLS